ncbi:MAG TPA: oligosaccharide flippase family protein [Methanothermobacter sp.]|nr:oligosaccharide flippase family protein [Methanothermobacter sp.]
MAFVLLIYLARILGEADFGKYSFLISLTTLLATLTDLGVNQLLVREKVHITDNDLYTADFPDRFH